MHLAMFCKNTTVWSVLHIEMGKLLVLQQWFETCVCFGLFGFDPFIPWRKTVTAESIVTDRSSKWSQPLCAMKDETMNLLQTTFKSTYSSIHTEKAWPEQWQKKPRCLHDAIKRRCQQCCWGGWYSLLQPSPEALHVFICQLCSSVQIASCCSTSVTGPCSNCDIVSFWRMMHFWSATDGLDTFSLFTHCAVHFTMRNCRMYSTLYRCGCLPCVLF